MLASRISLSRKPGNRYSSMNYSTTNRQKQGIFCFFLRETPHKALPAPPKQRKTPGKAAGGGETKGQIRATPLSRAAFATAFATAGPTRGSKAAGST